MELRGAHRAIPGRLGALRFLDRNLENFIHAHPAESTGAAPDPARPHIHGVSDAVPGPPPSSVAFTTNFDKPGNYRLWAQFQVAGVPVVIPFQVEVRGAASLSRAPKTIPARAIRVLVDARGFTPARIEAITGMPVTLAITRAATPNCGSRIVFPSLGIERDLPVGETSIIELPRLTGGLVFACGMGMFRGAIVAVPQ